MDGFKRALILLGVLFVILFVPTLLFLALDNDVAAAVTGTLTVGVVFALTHVAAFAGGTWYTRSTMLMGADVALRAQESNDRWDERKSVTMGRLIQEGARIGRQAGTPEAAPAFPLPSQGLEWLPPVATYQGHEIDAEEWD